MVLARNTFIEVSREEADTNLPADFMRHARTDYPKPRKSLLEEDEMSPADELCRAASFKDLEFVMTPTGRVAYTPTSPSEQLALAAALGKSCFGLPSSDDEDQNLLTPTSLGINNDSYSSRCFFEASSNQVQQISQGNQSTASISNPRSQQAPPSIWPAFALPHTMFCVPVLVPLYGPTDEPNMVPSSPRHDSAPICELSQQCNSCLSKYQQTEGTTDLFHHSENGPANFLLDSETTDSSADKPNARTRLLGQVLRKQKSFDFRCQRFAWCVDARKLHGNTKQVVSPPFEVSTEYDDKCAPFKLTLYPKRFRKCKGGVSFDGSRGRGHVQLKCEGELSSEIAFSISIGSESKKQVTRGPVPHDFSQTAVATLPKGQDEWNFFSAVDDKSETFMVVLEITSVNSGDDKLSIDSAIGGA